MYKHIPLICLSYLLHINNLHLYTYKLFQGIDLQWGSEVNRSSVFHASRLRQLFFVKGGRGSWNAAVESQSSCHGRTCILRSTSELPPKVSSKRLNCNSKPGIVTSIYKGNILDQDIQQKMLFLTLMAAYFRYEICFAPLAIINKNHFLY